MLTFASQNLSVSTDVRDGCAVENNREVREQSQEQEKHYDRACKDDHHMVQEFLIDLLNTEACDGLEIFVALSPRYTAHKI
jgi:hypothetical protein